MNASQLVGAEKLNCGRLKECESKSSFEFNPCETISPNLYYLKDSLAVYFLHSGVYAYAISIITDRVIKSNYFRITCKLFS